MLTAKKNILITRPEAQGQALKEQGKNLNYTFVLLPQVKITPVIVANIKASSKQNNPIMPDPLVITAHKKAYDIVIFISPNAIKYGFATVTKHIAYQQLAVVGNSSLALLTKKQVTCTIYPKKVFSSEGLLHHPALQQLDNNRILIVRGGTGREKLKNSLENRGAKVDYLDVYQRQAIHYSPQQIAQRLPTTIDIVQISSQQALNNLMPYIKNTRWFNACDWWVLSPRIKKSCIQYGITASKCQIIKPGNQAFIKNL